MVGVAAGVGISRGNLGRGGPKGSSIMEMFYQPVRLPGLVVFDPFAGGLTMDPFEELVEQLREIGRQEVPCSPDFTARTMARLAAIRPFGVPAKPLPAPKPLWRRWWVPASAAAVLLVAVAVWAIPHVLHRQSGTDAAPASPIAPAVRQNVTNILQGDPAALPLPADKKPDALSPVPVTPDTHAALSVPAASSLHESTGSEHKSLYAPDPVFVQPDQRQQPPTTGSRVP